MEKGIRFIIVDDDPLNNLLCKFSIKKIASDAEVIDFLFPKQGIEYIEKNYNAASPIPTVLLLDINMPVMSGWDFLDRYVKLDASIKSQFTIFILSSSVDQRDKERAANNPYIKDYLIKPLTTEMLEKIIGNDHKAIV